MDAWLLHLPAVFTLLSILSMGTDRLEHAAAHNHHYGATRETRAQQQGYG